jgi:hypothetical protein
MTCKKAWSDQFLVANLNRVFCEKDYKKHRKGLLLERELSKLPETMVLAERQRKADKEESKLNELNKQIGTLNAEIRMLIVAGHTIRENIRHIKQGTDADGKAPEPERRKFIMACPNDTCRGYLSTQYKCELCETYTCPHCLELIGYSKTDPHTCNPDNVASAELIKKDTKPCPQCGVRIHKISGCDQMWCTECRVAFSYKTLKIDSGAAVHNPHYYQYMQRQNHGVAPRNPQDVVCGGLIHLNRVNTMILPSLKTLLDDVEYATMATYIQDIHRSISHISFYDLPRMRTDVRELQDHSDLRVQFILNKTSREDLTNMVYKRDMKRKKSMELLHLYELLNVVGIETFNALATEGQTFARAFVKEPRGLPMVDKTKHTDSVNEKILALDNLRDYCNKRFAKISVTYNLTVTQITDMWQIRTKKYKIADAK